MAGGPGKDQASPALHCHPILHFAVRGYCQIQAIFAKRLEQPPSARGELRRGRVGRSPDAPETHTGEGGGPEQRHQPE